MTFDPTQQIKDLEHLRLLKIGYYVYAALCAFGALVPLIHITLGFIFMAGAFGGPDDPPQWIGVFFVFFGLFLMFVLGVMAYLYYLAGRMLGERRGRTFCLIMAAIACLNIPLGTVLGVFTFIVLMRPSVIALYNAAPLTPPPAIPRET